MLQASQSYSIYIPNYDPSNPTADVLKQSGGSSGNYGTWVNLLMTAEAGWLGEMTGGRDKKTELMEAVQEYKATGRDDGPAVRRLYGG